MITTVKSFEFVGQHTPDAYVRVVLHTEDDRPEGTVERDTLLTFKPTYADYMEQIINGATGDVFATDLTGLAVGAPKELIGRNVLTRYLDAIALSYLNQLVDITQDAIDRNTAKIATETDPVRKARREHVTEGLNGEIIRLNLQRNRITGNIG